MDRKERAKERRKRVFEVIEVGSDFDFFSRGYDFLNSFSIIANLTASILYTFEYMREHIGFILLIIEEVTVAFFAIDYLLRIWTADYLYPEVSRPRAIWKYMKSFTGIVDLLCFLPYLLPFFFPQGAVAFRMIRVIRILRLFRINSYYDSLKVITDVLYDKRQELISSVSIIVILMVASSLCMYSLEHEAQPEIFSNALSGICWSASTLLTVGYGDIYPITTLGKIFGIIITFLGVGMVAIPTGIISAGFVDQYSRVKRMTEYGQESDVHFIKIQLQDDDPWSNETIDDIQLPAQVIVAAVDRSGHVMVPTGDLRLLTGDTLILGAEAISAGATEDIRLKETVLEKNNPWVGMAIQDLNISRQTVIVLVRRDGKGMIPTGDLVLQEGDEVILYTEGHMSNATEIEV